MAATVNKRNLKTGHHYSVHVSIQLKIDSIHFEREQVPLKLFNISENFAHQNLSLHIL